MQLAQHLLAPLAAPPVAVDLCSLAQACQEADAQAQAAWPEGHPLRAAWCTQEHRQARRPCAARPAHLPSLAPAAQSCRSRPSGAGDGLRWFLRQPSTLRRCSRRGRCSRYAGMAARARQPCCSCWAWRRLPGRLPSKLLAWSSSAAWHARGGHPARESLQVRAGSGRQRAAPEAAARSPRLAAAAANPCNPMIGWTDPLCAAGMPALLATVSTVPAAELQDAALPQRAPAAAVQEGTPDQLQAPSLGLQRQAAGPGQPAARPAADRQPGAGQAAARAALPGGRAQHLPGADAWQPPHASQADHPAPRRGSAALADLQEMYREPRPGKMHLCWPAISTPAL